MLSFYLHQIPNLTGATEPQSHHGTSDRLAGILYKAPVPSLGKAGTTPGLSDVRRRLGFQKYVESLLL